jgi:hypothetical protein
MPKAQNGNRNMQSAPMPGGNFVKLAVGGKVSGTMDEARMEVQQKKNKKGKAIEKERYIFSLKLDKETVLLVGKKKQEKERTFNEGDVVTLPDHGFLVNTLRRTACKIAGTSYAADQDTDLSPLVGRYFEITRREDGEITSGEFAGTASALYDVQFDAAEPAVA